MKWFLITLIVVLTAGLSFGQDEQTQTREVTLQQAIDAALKTNLDIEIETYNPKIVETSVTFEKSKFDPLFSMILNGNSSTFPTGSALSGASVNQKNIEYDFSLAQKLFTGTTYQLDFRNTRVNTNQNFTSVNPRYDTSLFASITQPLLRNFGIDITRTPAQIAMQNRISADQRLKQRVMDIALQVEQVYWDLSYFRDTLAVRQQSLDRAKELFENNKKQVDVGTMAPLEIVVAQAEVASREQAIIALETQIRNTEDTLKTLVLGRDVSKSWDIEMIPVEKATLQDVSITEDEAIKRSLENNPDLKAISSDLASRKLNTKLAKNELKPQLDLKAQIGASGLGGTTLITDDNFPPNVIGTVPGGFGDALSTLFDNGTYGIGVVFSLPIFNRAAKSDYVRADLQEKQTSAIFDNAQQIAILNVRTVFRNIKSDLKQLDSARASRVLQEQKLDAERKKLNVGLSTDFVVLQFQDDLSQAQSLELLAVVSLSKDRALLNRYLGETSYLAPTN